MTPDRHPIPARCAAHVWRIDLDAAPSGDPASVLSDEEQARATAFVHARDRTHYTRGRAGLRRILGGYLGTVAAAVPIVAGPHGKPELGGNDAGALSFNASGSDGMALVAIVRTGRIGVDIERVRPIADLEGVARLVLAPAERAVFDASPDGIRLDGFHASWVRKEAYVKAIGEGLLRPLDRIDCSASCNGRDAILDADDPDSSHRWRIAAWRPTPQFHAAVVTEISLVELLHFDILP